MKTIDITTTHNVVIRYPLASIMDRFLAFIIDGIITMISIGLLTWFLSIFLGVTVAATIAFVVMGLYHFLMETYNKGQSIGKKAMNVSVINLQGQNPSMYEAFLRWIFRMVDITLSIGTLGIFSAMSSDKNQRIGDVFAHTAVIKNTAEKSISLEKVLQIDQRDREVLYPQVAQRPESEILLIKEVLQRYTQYPTEANRTTLLRTAKIMAQKLNITHSTEHSKELLTELIIDYVYLTR